MKKREKLKKTICLCGSDCCSEKSARIGKNPSSGVNFTPPPLDFLDCWQWGQWEVNVDPVTKCITATISASNWCNPSLGFAFIWTNCTDKNPDGSYNNPF